MKNNIMINKIRQFGKLFKNRFKLVEPRSYA